MIQVETWFETGDSPRAAKVQVFAGNGRLIAEGQCDERGIFVFDYSGSEPLRVVVDAGAGHRAEAAISKAMLTNQTIYTAIACLSPSPPLLTVPLLVPMKLDSPPAPPPVVRRTGGVPWGRLALGVGLLLTVAGAALVRLKWCRGIGPSAS